MTPREELIALRRLAELEAKTRDELIEIAKDLGVSGGSGLRKEGADADQHHACV